jgi:hypothetical protein
VFWLRFSRLRCAGVRLGRCLFKRERAEVDEPTAEAGTPALAAAAEA